MLTFAQVKVFVILVLEAHFNLASILLQSWTLILNLTRCYVPAQVEDGEGGGGGAKVHEHLLFVNKSDNLK